ncbi:hypothetical protein Plano_0542 [Planococcus sp. PAMC 21323]|uniref:restriction endonuclease subunit S n=1 Tax=Planococcus sp. PAMC 21323 TaxID=1526927 RepID=UPI000585E0A5|nr:restriction endonuclease subunit S [Planococcus sp. PAMC 21323]AIY04507.1 hypothetical protein Plano_0542 [Planococcus sp. PAMC 21323]
MNVPQLRFSGFDGDWEIKKIKDFATVTSSKRVYLNDYVTNGIPFYRGKEITELKSGKTPEDVLYISNDRYEEFKTRFGAPVKGDILITAVGTIGNSMLVENDVEFYFKDGNLIWLREVNQNPKFLLYVFSNPAGHKKLLDSASGSNQKALTIVGLNKLEYKVPKIEEQNKIASFFSLIDQKVQKQQEKIEKLEQFKKGMMQKVFSQELRFKDEDGGEFGEWEAKQLKEFATKTVKKNKDMKVTNVISNSAKQGLISQRSYFKKDIANELNIDGYYVISKGDFVYNPRISSESPYGPVHFYELEEDGIVSPLYLCFKTKNINSKFLKYFFMSSQWYKHIYTHGDSGARHDRVSIKDAAFFEMKIAMPSMVEQEKISGVLDVLYLKIEKEKEKLRVLEEQKRGFMRGMFV